MSNIEDMIDESVALDKEDWLQIVQDLMEIGPILKACISDASKRYPDLMHQVSAMDPETFEADIRAACAAMSYVAEFAADKCRFIVVKEE